ncbi:MAG: DHH family phosphoesterase [Oscillospiraceae bacterium]|nr:DHH family phosphoesterase [Oscillospiraceae bacterium]
MKNFYRHTELIISVIALILMLGGFSYYLYRENTGLFWIVAPFIVLVAGFVIGKLITVTRKTYQYFAFIHSAIQKADRTVLYNLSLPIAVVDDNPCFVWFNKSFRENFRDIDYGHNLSVIFNGDIKLLLDDKSAKVTYKGRRFSVSALNPDSTIERIQDERKKGEIYIVCFENITKQTELETQLRQKHPVAIFIMVDNYDEMFDGVLDSEKAHVTVKIDKLLEEFVAGTNGIMKKFNRDRVWVVLESRDVMKIIEGKVKILDKAREIAVKDRLNVTFSIGIGTTGKTLAESEVFARQALEMALGRGGDQAVVKTGNGFEFYGGVSKGIERHVKVKSRIITNSLIDLVENSSSVYIMGHKYSDLDSIGASVGLAGAISNLGRKTYIVVDKPSSLGQELITMVKDSEQDKHGVFIQPNKAREQFGDDSLLIIVDTHNPNLVEDEEIYNRALKVVVIDHHRKTVNFIDNALIFHHEPHSSSASEMVAEMLQYFGAAGRITAAQAEALLAGIMLDTKNFTLKTGVRTFEAAAFLRKLGADTVNVKSFFANSFENYRHIAKLVGTAKLHKKCAIASTDETYDNVRLLAPQAADEMLAITGVEASFAIYKVGSDIHVSARSMGGINVQLIMEYLGGGGHFTMAGTQMKDITLAEAQSRTVSAIDLYYDNQN